MNQYELFYVIGTDNDLMKLRTLYRNHEVYMYPLNIAKKRARALFSSIMIRANKLSKEPEFYNTLTNNCTTNLFHHINSATEKDILWSPGMLFTAFSDRILYNENLIDTSLPF